MKKDYSDKDTIQNENYGLNAPGSDDNTLNKRLIMARREMANYEFLISRFEMTGSTDVLIDILTRLCEELGLIVCISSPIDFDPAFIREIVAREISEKYSVPKELIYTS